MTTYKTSITVFALSIFSIFQYSIAISQPLSLKVAGDSLAGFQVFIYSNDRLVVANTEEFSLQLFNLDLSTEANLQWTGQKWTGDEKRITLQRDSYIKELD